MGFGGPGGYLRVLWQDPGIGGLWKTRVYWDNGKENGNYKDYKGHIGII